MVESCLKQLQARLAFLFDALARQLGARRAGLQRPADAPADIPSLQAACLLHTTEWRTTCGVPTDYQLTTHLHSNESL